MKTFLLGLVAFLIFSVVSPVYAGDCTTRDFVDWHATISSATHIRVDCDDHKGPVGDSVGVAPAGLVVRILEVDRNREYFVVETSFGVGFVYKSFLKDIQESPLAVTPETKVESEEQGKVFADLFESHPYYQSILDVKEKGIVNGTPDGNIHPDDPINRVELAKILVEATTDDLTISRASLADGTYVDVQKGAWYLPYLEIAKRKKIMTGDKIVKNELPTVRPGDSSNGAEVAKMIAVAFDLQVRAAVDGEAWYVPYLEVLKNKGALPYDSADHFVTRGEMMFMISTVLKD